MGLKDGKQLKQQNDVSYMTKKHVSSVKTKAKQRLTTPTNFKTILFLAYLQQYHSCRLRLQSKLFLHFDLKYSLIEIICCVIFPYIRIVEIFL